MGEGHGFQKRPGKKGTGTSEARREYGRVYPEVLRNPTQKTRDFIPILGPKPGRVRMALTYAKS